MYYDNSKNSERCDDSYMEDTTFMWHLVMDAVKNLIDCDRELIAVWEEEGELIA